MGLYMAYDNGLKHLLVELDSLSVFWLISKPYKEHHPNSTLIRAIKHVLIRYWSIIISHIYQEANGCADGLAKFEHFVKFLHLFF